MNDQQELERARCRVRYLEWAVKTFGLSIGIEETYELLVGDLDEAGPCSEEIGPPGTSVNNLSPFIHSGNASTYHLTAQIMLCQHFGLPYEDGVPPYLELPGFGQSAVRIVLWPYGAAPPPEWLIEAKHLDPVPTHFLCRVDLSDPCYCVGLVGWASRDELAQATKAPLVEGGPEVFRFPIDRVHKLKNGEMIERLDNRDVILKNHPWWRPASKKIAPASEI